MQTKLTLRMESELIERAKAHASTTGRSLSQLVADYFELLATAGGTESADVPATVRDLHGCLAPVRGKRAAKAERAAEVQYADYRDAKYGAAGRTR